jgi:aromatic ring-cleaving dioxygenase
VRRHVVAIGVAAALIAFILITVYARFDVDQHRTQIQSEMERQLGRRVALGNLKLRLLPPHLQVDSLTIFEDSNFEKSSPFLKAQHADLSIGLFPLLRNRIDIGTIELQRPTIEVVKNTKGIWNFTSLGYGINQPPGTPTDVGLKGNVILHDGQVAVTNLLKKTDRKIYDHIDLKLEGLAPGKPVSIDLKTRTEGGQRVSMQGKVGPLSQVALDQTPIDGTLKLKRVEIDGLRNFLDAPVLARTDGFITGKTDIKTENGTQNASGSFDLENARVNGLEIGEPVAIEYTAEADPVANVVTIGSSTLRLGKAPISVKGSINLQPTPAELNLKVSSDFDDASEGYSTELGQSFRTVGKSVRPRQTELGEAWLDRDSVQGDGRSQQGPGQGPWRQQIMLTWNQS